MDGSARKTIKFLLVGRKMITAKKPLIMDIGSTLPNEVEKERH